MPDLLPPTGAQFPISFGEYRAVVTQVGATLRGLWYQERSLVAGFAEDEPMPLHRGAVLAPWPNRIRDGQYRWHGELRQLPINEPRRQCALHGLVAWLPWSCEAHEGHFVTLGCTIWPQPGYPHLLRLTIMYRLGADGLTITLRAHNQGSSPAPYGCSIHPYLTPGPGPVDAWSLRLPAGSFLTVDPERLLPTGLASVEDTDFDFRDGGRLAGTKIDHAFTDFQFDQGDPCRALVTAEDGFGVSITWDARCRWVQVHTADRPEPQYNRSGLALEPMTCPPDAFRSGDGLIILKPGEISSTWWRLSGEPDR